MRYRRHEIIQCKRLGVLATGEIEQDGLRRGFAQITLQLSPLESVNHDEVGGRRTAFTEEKSHRLSEASPSFCKAT